MSNPLALLGTAVTAASFLGDNILFKTSNERSFKNSTTSIIAPCTISERHEDQYVITEHPTEMGVLITDHMYALPKTVDIQLAYSLSHGINALKAVGALISASKSPVSLEDYYKQFLKLQSDREPFSIVTGKRKYTNMLIENISNVTDGTSENMLMLSIRAKQILIVNTSYTTNSKYQKDAANTASPNNNGNQTLKAL